jgi:hypothetical protein
MKMVTVSFSEQEFEKLGIQNDTIDFKDLYELISIENSRLAVLRCHRLLRNLIFQILQWTKLMKRLN